MGRWPSPTLPPSSPAPSGQAAIGVIGAGNFAKMTLMPALAKTGTKACYVADINGAAAHHLARKFGGTE